jgi:hypothetical protein
LECGSLLPLLHQPASWLGFVLSAEIPASKLAGSKAVASCRTPKLRRFMNIEMMHSAIEHHERFAPSSQMAA